jgi:CRISPR-associated protein Csx17
MSDALYDLALPGCTPEPLMAYLKALGILRLVSEQKDKEARGWWKNDVFWLRSSLDRNTLATFFLEEYKPTPIVVPWSGGDFFGVNWVAQTTTFKETPTSSKAIEAILTMQNGRFDTYRHALQACKIALERCGIDTKEKMEKHKWAFIQGLRSNCDEPCIVEWIDAAAVGTVEKFAALLGSGGGSDGNTHFSDNFMQNLWDVLPDFDSQRLAAPRQPNHPTVETSRELLQDALFQSGTNRLAEKRTSSLYDAGAVGGPNATQGMERESLSNPWNVILALEGTVGFAGAVTKRLVANTANEGAFPFQVSASVTVQNGLTANERGGTEVWLPLWMRPTRSNEVLVLLREGRAQCGPRSARNGVDMARAVASLGVDRGIGAFGRYAILKGRVGGKNYNTAASLGRFYVAERADVDLLREVDPWLDRFRRAAREKNAPPRFGSALCHVDSAIFDFCRYGGKPLFQKILIAFGCAERELALTPGKVGQSKWPPGPLAGLSSDWIGAADDHSPEFAIARALSGVYDPEGKIGPLRANLDPVTVRQFQESRVEAKWAEKDRAVVWNTADLPANLVSVLARRMMDGNRAGCQNLPLASPAGAPLSVINDFITGELNDRRIEDLLWGLMLVKSIPHHALESEQTPAIPAAYALLKLLFLPKSLIIERRAGSRVAVRYAKQDENGVCVRPEPRISHLLRAGRLGEACTIAMRRLRASGLAPMPRARSGRTRDNDWLELDQMGSAGTDPIRLAASLLIPIASASISTLVRLVTRTEEIETGSLKF